MFPPPVESESTEPDGSAPKRELRSMEVPGVPVQQVVSESVPKRDGKSMGVLGVSA